MQLSIEHRQRDHHRLVKQTHCQENGHVRLSITMVLASAGGMVVSSVACSINVLRSGIGWLSEFENTVSADKIRATDRQDKSISNIGVLE